MRAISLGWGVQSFTLAAMAALGEIQADVAIHADTTYERNVTYAFRERWEPWLIQNGLRLIIVSCPEHAVKVASNKTDIPAFTKTPESDGQLRRQCTHRWKIEPIRRWLTSELKRIGKKKQKACVTQLLGISLDEYQRMSDSDVQWIQHEYPLIDMRMTRADCESWLRSHDLPIPPKSACVFCPYQNKKRWEELKRTGGDDWQTAVSIDTAIRHVRPPHDLFLHPGRLPLVQAIRLVEEDGYQQASLFDNDDGGCESGYCFV